ncbi:GNAT family N-acetyltransferase [Nocardia sp. NPDC050406]|uniref:GNAT family N-acetyltransferase n=1 Tax=Nocardia sp. NPDC050406 TaxID=3364318 RepID=UPI0037A44A58
MADKAVRPIHPPRAVPRVRVRPANKRDIPAMVELIDGAFRTDDPFGEWMFPDDGRRERGQPRMYRAMIRHQYLPADGAAVALLDDRVVGALLWQPTDYRVGVLRYLASLPEFVWAVRSDGPRAMAMDAAIAKLAPGLPHYFGTTLAVAPDTQNRGVGKALIAHLLAQVESAQVPLLYFCKDANVDYYRAFGAQTLGKVHLDRRGPRVNVMMWLPRGLR